MEKNSLPKLKESNFDISKYEMIFVGYPVWWYTAPMAVFTFLEENNLSGKRVILFCSHGTGGLASSVRDITAKLSESTIESNVIGIYQDEVLSSKNKIHEWLSELGYAK